MSIIKALSGISMMHEMYPVNSVMFKNKGELVMNNLSRDDVSAPCAAQ